MARNHQRPRWAVNPYDPEPNFEAQIFALEARLRVWGKAKPRPINRNEDGHFRLQDW